MNNTMALLPDIKLRFNIDHPTFEECYAYGYECALAEIGESENPYPANSKNSEQWVEGWWAGFYGEEPLYELDVVDEGSATELTAANDHSYSDTMVLFFAKVMEITGVLAVSAAVGFQVIDLVA